MVKATQKFSLSASQIFSSAAMVNVLLVANVSPADAIRAAATMIRTFRQMWNCLQGMSPIWSNDYSSKTLSFTNFWIKQLYRLQSTDSSIILSANYDDAFVIPLPGLELPSPSTETLNHPNLELLGVNLRNYLTRASQPSGSSFPSSPLSVSPQSRSHNMATSPQASRTPSDSEHISL
jgi:hypothetical protein